MYISKISKTLIEPYDFDWEQLTVRELGIDTNQDRKHSYCLARQALRLCFLELGINVPILDLSIKHHSLLDSFPNYTFSLSHTAELGAAILGDKTKYRSVGIDIEPITRHVTDAIARRISHPDDINLLNLEKWIIKEAVFKALMNTGQFEKPQEFQKLILQDEGWFHEVSGINGKWKIRTFEQYLIAEAWSEI